MNLIDDEGESKTEVNIHALFCCLETYSNNVKKILEIIQNIKNFLKGDQDNFMESLIKGEIPAFLDFKKGKYKSEIMLGLTK